MLLDNNLKPKPVTVRNIFLPFKHKLKHIPLLPCVPVCHPLPLPGDYSVFWGGGRPTRNCVYSPMAITRTTGEGKQQWRVRLNGGPQRVRVIRRNTPSLRSGTTVTIAANSFFLRRSLLVLSPSLSLSLSFRNERVRSVDDETTRTH